MERTITLTETETMLILANLPSSESQCLSTGQWLAVQALVAKLTDDQA